MDREMWQIRLAIIFILVGLYFFIKSFADNMFCWFLIALAGGIMLALLVSFLMPQSQSDTEVKQ